MLCHFRRDVLSRWPSIDNQERRSEEMKKYEYCIKPAINTSIEKHVGHHMDTRHDIPMPRWAFCGDGYLPESPIRIVARQIISILQIIEGTQIQSVMTSIHSMLSFLKKKVGSKWRSKQGTKHTLSHHLAQPCCRRIFLIALLPKKGMALYLSLSTCRVKRTTQTTRLSMRPRKINETLDLRNGTSCPIKGLI